jgi:hypothetical protein
MQALLSQFVLLAIVLAFFVWRTCTEMRQRRDRVLRDRVAFLLWVAASRVDAPAELAEIDFL